MIQQRQNITKIEDQITAKCISAKWKIGKKNIPGFGIFKLLLKEIWRHVFY